MRLLTHSALFIYTLVALFVAIFAVVGSIEAHARINKIEDFLKGKR